MQTFIGIIAAFIAMAATFASIFVVPVIYAWLEDWWLYGEARKEDAMNQRTREYAQQVADRIEREKEAKRRAQQEAEQRKRNISVYDDIDEQELRELMVQWEKENQ